MKKGGLLAFGLWVALVVFAAGDTASPAQSSAQSVDSPPPAVWLGPDGVPLPLRGGGEVAKFLRAARVVSSEDIATGITRPKKLLLELGGIRAHAIFRYGDTKERELRRAGRGTARWVHDTYRNEVAAYGLSRLLGMDNLPPAVERRIKGVPGSLQLWLEGAMTEGERLERGLEPPDATRWNRQAADRRIFDELIGNADRNAGNTLIDSGWKAWLIDHTRAFGLHQSLLEPRRVERCSRRLWEMLRALDPVAVRKRLGSLLGKTRSRALFARRDRLVKRLEQRIAERGERWVIFRYGDPLYEIERSEHRAADGAV